jgi:hypothetical protein
MKINHSFQINSLLKMIFLPLLGELFCEGKNLKVKNDHKSFLRENWFEMCFLLINMLENGMSRVLPLANRKTVK